MIMSCSPYSDSFGSPTITFAEENICGWIAQPANSWSNLAFLIVALLIAREIHSQKLPKLLLSFPAALAIVGLSSFFYHASATFVGQFFDFGSIYLLASLLLYLALHKRFSTFKYLVPVLSAVTVICLLTLWFVPVLRIWIFAAQLFVYLYFELNNKHAAGSEKAIFLALGTFLAAWSFWWLDVLYIWDYSPLEHLFNGHALWHILNAVSIYFLYRFYKQNV